LPHNIHRNDRAVQEAFWEKLRDLVFDSESYQAADLAC
jgi:hypothetical protein